MSRVETGLQLLQSSISKEQRRNTLPDFRCLLICTWFAVTPYSSIREGVYKKNLMVGHLRAWIFLNKTE